MVADASTRLAATPGGSAPGREIVIEITRLGRDQTAGCRAGGITPVFRREAVRRAA